MVHEITPSDRVQIRQRSDLVYPAVCAMCGNGTDVDGFIDVGVWYEWEGQVYFCHKCGLEIARAIGCLMPDESRYLEDMNRKMAEELKVTKEQLDDLKHFADLADRFVSQRPVGPDNSTDLAFNQESADESVSATEPTQGAAKREPVTKKPVAGRGPNDAKRSPVRNTASTSFSI